MNVHDYIGNVLMNDFISFFARYNDALDFRLWGALFHTLAESLMNVFFALLDPPGSKRLPL